MALSRKNKTVRTALAQLILFVTCALLAYPQMRFNEWCLTHDHSSGLDHETDPVELFSADHEHFESSADRNIAAGDEHNPCVKSDSLFLNSQNSGQKLPTVYIIAQQDKAWSDPQLLQTTQSAKFALNMPKISPYQKRTVVLII